MPVWRIALCAIALHAGLGAVELPVDPASWEKPTWNTAASREDGGKVLGLRTGTTDWHSQVKTWLIYDADVARLAFTGAMRTEGVSRGEADYEAARAQVSFHGAEGEQLGGWPTTTDRSGTTPWQPFTQEHRPPAGVRAVQVWLGMYRSTGAACYRDLSVTAWDAAGHELVPRVGRPLLDRPTDGWWTFAPGVEDPARPLVVDLSATVEAPAGARGRVRAVGGSFAFTDGQPVRFWGSGAWDYRIAPEVLDQRLRRLRSWGVNMIRLHGIDAWDAVDSIIDYAPGAPSLLRADRLDQLDRTIAEAGKHGLYVYLDLLTKRRFRVEEGVIQPERMFGGKPAAMWDRTLIDLQKAYAEALLGHRNPYTGKRLADDPAIAFVGLINELTLLDPGAYGDLPQIYADVLATSFDAWCMERNLPRPAGTFPALLRAGDKPTWDFLTEKERSYYREMETAVRGLGYSGLLTGNNWQAQPANLAHCAELGFVDRHFYWDHPAGGWTPTSHFDNRPHLASLRLFSDMVGQRVAGVPFTISEWNFVWCNEWIGEGPLEMAAFAGFQDYGALLGFVVNGAGWQPTMRKSFDADGKPQFMLPFIAAGLSYRRGDVAPGPESVIEVRADATTANAVPPIAPERAIAQRIGLRLHPGAAPAPAPSRPPQLRWEDRSAFIVDTPSTQGFVASRPGVTATTDLRVATRTPFCQVVATALDGLPLSASRRLLLVATARAQNTGQTRHAFTKGMLDEGRAPILIEPVAATIELPIRTDGAAPRVSALDWYGRRTDQEITPVVVEGRARIEIGTVQAGWYEISY